MKSLPPLNALRAFEAAARHLSFSLAARELHVTPGAISQQIKGLEQYLDMPLFKRMNRMITLTEAGLTLQPELNRAFRLMQQGVEAIKIQQEQTPLMITAPPSFVAKWLIPRLTDFNQQHPDIDVRIDSSTRLVDFEQENIDVGIRFSLTDDPQLDSTHLMSLDVIPVCSPQLLSTQPGLVTPQDLKHQTLLHYDIGMRGQSWPDWEMWLKTMDIEGVDTAHGIYFNQPDMLIQAAIEGQGVALVATVFADTDIRNGRLVQPFDLKMPIHFSYYLVSSRINAHKKKVQAFKQWIVAQCAQIKPEQETE